MSKDQCIRMANDSPEPVGDVPRSAESGLSGGAYIAITLLIFIAISATTIGLLIKPAGWLPKQQDSLSSQFIYFFSKRKLEISEKLQGPRFVVLGGSGALHSVRAAQLSSALDKNVINWGTQADLGLAYLLFNAKKVLRPGDTVILVLEYSQYVSTGPSWTLADYVIPHDLAYLQTLAPQELISLLGKLTISEYARKVVDRWQGPLADGSLALEAINDAGDLIVNNQVDQRSHHKESLSRYPVMGPQILSKAAREKITDFLRWCRGNGIYVVSAFPAFLDHPTYHTASASKFFSDIKEFYLSLGVPTLGSPSDYFFSKDMFFDTGYHMTAEGAKLMTDRMLPHLVHLDFHTLAQGCPASVSPARRPNCFIDFSRNGYPGFISRASGLSRKEPWGRWTDGDRAEITFSESLPKKFELEIVVNAAFGDNAKGPIFVRIGGVEKSFHFTSKGETIRLPFSLSNDATSIEIVPPSPMSPKALGLGMDARRLGVGLSSVRVVY
jgi:hypothetical protein